MSYTRMPSDSPPSSNNDTECYQLDVQLIAKAHELIHSQGDGRISVADITELAKEDYSSPDKVETLLYLYKTLNFTNAAKKYLFNAIKITPH